MRIADQATSTILVYNSGTAQVLRWLELFLFLTAENLATVRRPSAAFLLSYLVRVSASLLRSAGYSSFVFLPFLQGNLCAAAVRDKIQPSNFVSSSRPLPHAELGSSDVQWKIREYISDTALVSPKEVAAPLAILAPSMRLHPCPRWLPKCLSPYLALYSQMLHYARAFYFE